MLLIAITTLFLQAVRVEKARRIAAYVGVKGLLHEKTGWVWFVVSA
jgi:hypothetical protein